MSQLTVLREIAPSAQIASGVKIGQFCVVGPNVTIGPGTTLVRRVCITGHTTMGSNNVLQDGVALGCEPQDLKFAGGPTVLEVGHRNVFGRGATAHVGTEYGGGLTRIGSDNRFADGAHIAHDCYVDDRTTLGRGVLLAGHIRVQTGAVIGDRAGIHHFCTIGRYAFVGPRTAVRHDVPPFTHFRCDDDDPAPAVRGVHEKGIAAASLAPTEEAELRRALHELFDDESALQTKIEQLVSLGVEGEAANLCEFCQRSLRGVFGRYRELFRGQIPPEGRKSQTDANRTEHRRPLR